MEQYVTACRISEQKTVGFDGAGKFVPNPVKNSMGEARRHIRLLIAKESARFTVTDPNTQLAFLKTRVFMDES